MRDGEQSVLSILQNLNSLDPLKDLFWSQLNYERINQPLSRRGWPETATRGLAEDPLLFAGHGDFHVIYARLNSDRLLLGLERHIVNRLLRDHPYSLFLISDRSQTHWHFINVKYAEDERNRHLFRRITVGPNERLRTASERIAMLDLAAIAPSPNTLSPLVIQERHDEAFDVEAVTKQFFTIFAELYDKVANDITKVHGLENKAQKLAQLLLDQMIFLYFIQKKGWLNQRPDYLYARFQECWKEDPNGHSYYSNVLYPLFICLSDADTKIEGIGAIPFLNGGLFEESAKQTQIERLEQARLKIRNSTFKAIFDNLLERFNFTVTEDTPLDVEVAIDPEMLGKIFESLILQLEKDPDKDLRKLTGSYYTPRPIVHFMCQEALKEYLVTQLAGDDASKAKAAREKVGTLLALPHADHLDEEQVKALQKLFTRAEAEMLRQAILDCRTCDPAVGSGAFPVGMLHEMVSAVARLDFCLNGLDILKRRNYDYDLKKQIIESCLYGVDIQEQAVRLCELRLWLSLVVDYQIDPKKPFAQAIREVPSLPNLSYRIVRGDSLLERLFGHIVQLDQMAKDAKTKQLIESIQADKQSYFREGNTVEKRHLELKILAKQADLAERLIEAKSAALIAYQVGLFGDEDMTAKERRTKAEHEAQVAELADLKAKVTRVKTELERLSRQKGTLSRDDLDTLRRKYFQTGDAPTFMWRVDFAEVFVGKGGFDVIIANPPYLSFGLRGSKGVDQDWADIVRQLYPSSAEYKISVYALFLDLALKTAKRHGIVCYITPDSFLLGRYFSKLRRTILNSVAIKKIVMFKQDFWKSGVVGRPTISLLQRNMPGQLVTAVLCENEDIIVNGHLRKHTYLQDYFETMPYNRFRLFFSPTAMAFVKAVEAGSMPLKSVARITTGVRSKSGQENVVAMHSGGPKWKKGIISGGQVVPYHVEWKGHYLHIDGDLLFSGGWDASIVERPKIMIRQTGDTIIAAIDQDHLYHLNNVHSLAPLMPNISLPYLCAVLNSRLMNRYYHLISLEYGRAMAQTDIETLELLPIRDADAKVIKEIEVLVASVDDPKSKSRLDNIIETLYDLSKDLIPYLHGEDLYPEVEKSPSTKEKK